MTSTRWGRGLLAWGLGLLLLAALAAPAAALTSVTACGALTADDNSYRLDADLHQVGTADCLTITRNGVTLDLNGHSISGLAPPDSKDGKGITGNVGGGPANNVTIKGPGVVHDFGTCIELGNYALVADVLVYNCAASGGAGIKLGDFSKCVQCRVHNVLGEEANATGIIMGSGCLLESSIVETSDEGARVGHDCKVWDLVLEAINETGLKVGYGTSVARTVISGGHNGPGIDYCDCAKGPLGPLGSACQDSSNSVNNNGALIVNNISDSTIDPGPYGEPCASQARVIPDCATNVNGARYAGAPAPNAFCPPPGP